MRNPPTLQGRPTDLTADDLRALTGSLESLTGFWRIKVTRAPGPDASGTPTRWAYLCWAGPPSEDIVPPIAITRHHKGCKIFVLDPLELFAAGMFEATDCGDIACTLKVVLEVIDEARETALDLCGPDVTTLASLLATRTPRETAEIRELILATMPTGILSS